MVGPGTGNRGFALRDAAVGGLAGTLSGVLFGACAVLIQTAITASLINRYGDNAVDHGAALLHSGFVVTMGLVGGFFGILYMTACRRLPWLARAGGLMFAALLTLVLQPLLAAGLDYFSAVVSITQSLTSPSGFTKTGSFPQDVAPPLLLESSWPFFSSLRD